MPVVAIYGDSSKQGIARRLDALRIAVSPNPEDPMSQAEFARHCGFTVQALNNYMQAVNRIQLDQAIALCLRTQVTLDWVYLGNPAGMPISLIRATEIAPAAEAKASRVR